MRTQRRSKFTWGARTPREQLAKTSVGLHPFLGPSLTTFLHFSPPENTVSLPAPSPQSLRSWACTWQPLASPAWLTLRTGVRYSATSSAFPFTVLITFCILGPEKWPALRQVRKGSQGRDQESEKSPAATSAHRHWHPRGRDKTGCDGTDWMRGYF